MRFSEGIVMPVVYFKCARERSASIERKMAIVFSGALMGSSLIVVTACRAGMGREIMPSALMGSMYFESTVIGCWAVFLLILLLSSIVCSANRLLRGSGRLIGQYVAFMEAIVMSWVGLFPVIALSNFLSVMVGEWVLLAGKICGILFICLYMISAIGVQE